MADALPERQQKVLDVIQEHLEEYGFPPTVREIGERIDVKSTSLVSYYLKRLEERGYISRESSMSRAIRLTSLVKKHVSVEDRDTFEVPLLGMIAAGSPIPVEVQPGTDLIEINEALFGGKKINPDELFALEVQGTSMVDALVNDGDTIVLQQRQQVENGQMAAVWLKEEGETTLKKVYREGKRIRLQPANPTMEAIMVPAKDVEIQGKVVLVIRKLN